MIFRKGMGMTVIYNNILEAMGNTPLIRLGRMAEEGSAQILVKFEGLNVADRSRQELPTT